MLLLLFKACSNVYVRIERFFFFLHCVVDAQALAALLFQREVSELALQPSFNKGVALLHKFVQSDFLSFAQLADV